MREITPASFTVYALDELEPKARQDAICNIQALLGGAWWDADDVQEVSDAIVYGLAEALGTPGWDRYGVGDFPGVPGVQLDTWDLDRGDGVGFAGELTPSNAPKMPWPDGFERVLLQSSARGARTFVIVEMPDEDTSEQRAQAARRLQEAVDEALFAAKEAGRVQLDYQTSEHRAVEDIEANEREFTADGQLYRG
jgi:hypothetical protein